MQQPPPPRKRLPAPHHDRFRSYNHVLAIADTLNAQVKSDESYCATDEVLSTTAEHSRSWRQDRAIKYFQPVEAKTTTRQAHCSPRKQADFKGVFNMTAFCGPALVKGHVFMIWHVKSFHWRVYAAIPVIF